jgi:hypothetical protein
MIIVRTDAEGCDPDRGTDRREASRGAHVGGRRRTASSLSSL